MVIIDLVPHVLTLVGMILLTRYVLCIIVLLILWRAVVAMLGTQGCCSVKVKLSKSVYFGVDKRMETGISLPDLYMREDRSRYF